jgi:hypothetical protein
VVADRTVAAPTSDQEAVHETVAVAAASLPAHSVAATLVASVEATEEAATEAVAVDRGGKRRRCPSLLACDSSVQHSPTFLSVRALAVTMLSHPLATSRTESRFVPITFTHSRCQ